MKVAVVHDWLVVYAGAEKALEQILQLYPEADLYSMIDYLPKHQRGFILDKKVSTSFIQSLPFSRKKYRAYLPLMPLAVEQFDLSDYDLVISSSYAVAKGVLTHSRQVHVCYCYSPMRYAWDLYHHYLTETGLDRGTKGFMAKVILHYMRMWDLSSSNRVDHFIAISHYIAKRIKKIYGRESTVVYPPVDTDFFIPGGSKEDYFLTASRFVPYKKIDLIVESFSRMPDRKLVVIGDGPDFRKISSQASKNIEFLGHQPAAMLKECLQKARAFVYAADEDFGIVTVEAQACGTPAIAFGRGGSLETIVEGQTGLFFREQTVESLRKALHDFEQIENRLDASAVRKNAERFSAARFRREFKNTVDELVSRRS